MLATLSEDDFNNIVALVDDEKIDGLSSGDLQLAREHYPTQGVQQMLPPGGFPFGTFPGGGF